MHKKLLISNYSLTLIATTMFTSTYYLLLPVLPLHMLEMGGSKFVIGLIMGLFSGSSLIFRPLAGRASDRKGPVKVLKYTTLLFFLTPLFYIYNSFFLISIAQLFYGFTIGAFTISSATVITSSVPTSGLSKAIGIHSIALVLAKGLAPTLGTLLYQASGLYPLIGITLLLAMSALLCIFRLTEVEPVNSTAPFSFKEVITTKMVWVPSLVLVTVTLTFGNIMTMLPLLALERNITGYSWFFTANTIAVVAIRLFTGKQTRYSQEYIISVSLIFMFIAVMILSGIQSIAILVLSAFIYGIGYGAVYPALSTLVVMNTPKEIRGSAFGLFTAFFDIGVTLGALWGGFSEFLGFHTVYFLASFAPIIGLFSFLFFLRKDNIWTKIFQRDKLQA